MKTFIAFVVLVCCLRAQAFESFEAFKSGTNAEEIVKSVESKINELRKRYEIPGKVTLQGRLKPGIKAKFNKIPKQIPDFEDRKRVVGELVGKLERLRAASRDRDVKPDRAEFFGEIRKALEESRQTKMVDIESFVNKTVRRQNVDGFATTISRLQSTIHQIQTAFFEEIIVSRAYMSRSVRFAHRPMVQSLGQATENLWHNGTNRTQTSAELNRCAAEAYTLSIRSIQRSYYPELDYTIVELSSALNTLNYDFSRTNMVRDQRSLIALLESDIQWMLLRGNNRETVLIWEVTNYIDQMRVVSRQLAQCLGTVNFIDQ